MIEILEINEKSKLLVYLFWDMHSGGRLKTKYSKIYIQAFSQNEAIDIFEQKFNRNPHHITCSCCGEDFSIYASETIEEATDFHRSFYDDVGNRKKLTIDDYLNKEDVLYLTRAIDV